ncbi:hypothetical protein PAXRUDRAFT_629825 [Paxillus rubicundulus Ve08.2h10]|uniref:Uncharacterized protein n=1 Tax=Paxillus rubicundulus Ve08.2h10 TaxID=930991 RepID=A0A0D0DK01_9AGAM|nr:hypothetical protein PAXRUDRAFT_629825 [Paxillus rubicundulus Ve08.2h10]
MSNPHTVPTLSSLLQGMHSAQGFSDVIEHVWALCQASLHCPLALLCLTYHSIFLMAIANLIILKIRPHRVVRNDSMQNSAQFFGLK